jgi:MFS family permease
MSVARGFAWGLAVFFFGATLFQLVDQLDLVAQPPNIPESANLVDRVLASIPYQQDIWPIFFAANLLIGLGFLCVVGLGFGLAAEIPHDDDRRGLLAMAFVAAGIIGAAGQLLLIGAVKAKIDIPYCDCGFKDQEIVSQVWAEMVTGSAQQWLLNGATLLAALGIVVGGRLFGSGGPLSERWRWLSYAIAVLVVVTSVLGILDLADDLQNVISLALTGILIPIWAIWLARGTGRIRAARADAG